MKRIKDDKLKIANKMLPVVQSAIGKLYDDELLGSRITGDGTERSLVALLDALAAATAAPDKGAAAAGASSKPPPLHPGGLKSIVGVLVRRESPSGREGPPTCPLHLHLLT